MGRIRRLIGKPLFIDRAQHVKQELGLLGYVLSFKFPNQVKFIDEFGKDVYQEVIYGCLSSTCTKCKASGHFSESVDKTVNAPKGGNQNDK